MTLGEGAAVLRAAGETEQRAGRVSLAQSWYTAALSRTKRLPRLKKLLDPVHVATPEEAADSKAAFDEVMAALDEAEVDADG